MTIIKIFIVITAIVGAFMGLMFVAELAIEKTEMRICKTLKIHSIQFKGNGAFYITPSENYMCLAHGIEIDAPIKRQ